MPISIPLTDDGDQIITVNVGPEIFMFRTYFVHGTYDHWLMDIFDAQENRILGGINLVPGIDNLLKGHGSKLAGYQLSVKCTPGRETALDAPGKDLFVLWYNPGEENPDKPLDPMDTLEKDLAWW